MAVPFVNLLCYTWMGVGGIYFIDLILKTNILFFLCLVSAGVFASFCIIAYCIYQPMIEDCFAQQDATHSIESKEEEELFEHKYLDQIEHYDKMMECTDEELKDLISKYVSDKCPMGDVLLTYNFEDEKFVYYSHTSNIPYKYLDTLCRQFVLEYRCVRLYCNIEEDVKQIEEEMKRNKEENDIFEEQPRAEDNSNEGEADEDLHSKSVFASFKSYNRAKHSAGVAVGGGTNIQKQINSNEQVVLKERINNYRYGGQIHEFKVKEEETGQEKKIDFTTFKEMIENKKSL